MEVLTVENLKNQKQHHRTISWDHNSETQNKRRSSLIPLKIPADVDICTSYNPLGEPPSSAPPSVHLISGRQSIRNVSTSGQPVSIEIENPVTQEPWLPYENAWTETPYLYIVHKLVRKWIQFRQSMLRNSYVSSRLPLPCFTGLNRAITLGEIVLLLTLLVTAVLTISFAMVNQWTVHISGAAAAVPTALTVVLCTRNSIFTLLFGIPFERQLYWHKLMAYTAVTIGWIHGYIALLKSSSLSTTGNLSGIVFGFALTLMILTSFGPIRRYFFNFFYFSHTFLFVFVGASGLWHNAGGIKFGLPLWICDLLLRYAYLTFIRNPHKAAAVVLPAHIVRLTFQKKNFQYCAGQYVFIMIPKINVFEWHPFSISSSPHHEKVTLHIKALGNWTRRLHELISMENEHQSEVHFRTREIDLEVYMDGPYGSPEVDIDSDRYKLFLLISGGIGITPMQSVCNQLVHEHEDRGRPMKKVLFIWSVADKFMVASAFEKDRPWVKGANKRDYTSRLPIASDPKSLRRLSVDLQILKRSNTFHRCLVRQESANGFPAKPQVDILHTEFYLTRMKKNHELHASQVQRDLQPYIRYGRPNYPEIFLTFRQFAIQHREHDIAVMVCGPKPMMNEVRALCSCFSQDGVKFDFHGEVFEF